MEVVKLKVVFIFQSIPGTMLQQDHFSQNVYFRTFPWIVQCSGLLSPADFFPVLYIYETCRPWKCIFFFFLKFCDVSLAFSKLEKKSSMKCCITVTRNSCCLIRTPQLSIIKRIMLYSLNDNAKIEILIVLKCVLF